MIGFHLHRPRKFWAALVQMFWTQRGLEASPKLRRTSMGEWKGRWELDAAQAAEGQKSQSSGLIALGCGISRTCLPTHLATEAGLRAGLRGPESALLPG